MKKTNTTNTNKVTKNVALDTISTIALDDCNRYFLAIEAIKSIRHKYDKKKASTKPNTPERDKINETISRACKKHNDTIKEFIDKYISDNYYYAYCVGFKAGDYSTPSKICVKQTKKETLYYSIDANNTFDRAISRLLHDLGIANCKNGGINKFIKAIDTRIGGSRTNNLNVLYKELSINTFKKNLIHAIFAYGLEKGVFTWTDNGYVNNYAD